MKTRFFTLLSVFCAASVLNAADVPVSPETFASEYEMASDGDVLLLSDGDYSGKITFPSAKTITLKAAENQSPVFSGTVGGDEYVNNGSLIFDGVTIDRNEQYVFSTVLGDVKLIAFRNLTIQNVNRSLIRTTNTEDGKIIDKIEIENCIIKDCGVNGYNFLYPGHIVKSVSVKNSTLYNYSGGESLFLPNHRGAIDATTTVFEFVFENNTVYKWAKDSKRALANLGAKYSPSSTYTFRNNIVNEPGVAGEIPKLLIVTEGIVTAENNLVVNYGGYDGGTQTINDLTLVGLGLDDIGFVAAASGNFTLPSTSPLATAGVGGKCVGDPRWIDSANSINNNSINNKEVKSVVYYNLQGNVISKDDANGLVIKKSTHTDGSVVVEKILK